MTIFSIFISCLSTSEKGYESSSLISCTATNPAPLLHIPICFLILRANCRNEALESGGGEGGGGSSIPYSFYHFEKYPISLNILKIQKALYPHIPKIDPSIPYLIKHMYLQKYPVSL